MNEEEKEALKILQGLCTDECVNSDIVRTIVKLIEKQQKEIERLKKESIGDTKYEKLLFSIRMLHFHHYINDTQFEKMINKLSNEGE